MNHLLHFVVQGRDLPLPWDLKPTEGRISILRARSLGEAASYLRVYSIVMIVADLTDWDEHAREALLQLRALAAEKGSPAIVGLTRFRDDREAGGEPVASAVDCVFREDDPPSFPRWLLDLMLRLEALSKFEQTRVDVNLLASQTRQKLHDLSQPLSAVQGRLQLMSARMAEDDPNSATFKELVRLTLNVTSQLMEIQHLHRAYS